MKLWGAAAGVLLLAGCARPPSLSRKPPEVPKGEKPTLTVIAGGSQAYWSQARRGAQDAGKKLGAHIVWQAPAGADPVKSQMKLVRDAIKTSHGLVLAPLDSTKLMQPVGEAARAGLDVAIFSHDVFTIQNKLSYVHNDDYQTGVLAAQQLEKVTSPSGRIVVLIAAPRLEVEERVRGFQETLKNRDVSEVTAETTKLVLPADADAVFCADETLSGALASLPSSKAKLVIYDAGEVLARSHLEKDIVAVLSPDYYRMAYQSVKAILDYRKQHVAPREIKIAPWVFLSK
jgi:ribose transport system substrate-binding protein